MKTCVIIGAVPVQNRNQMEEFCADAFVICADGGLDVAAQYGIVPDLLVGDFDSVQTQPPQGVETIHLPVHKDDTDTMFAIREAIRRGYQEFVLLGVLGGERFDHSYATLCALQFIAMQNCRGVLVGDHCQVFVLSSGRLRLRDMMGQTISVFPFGTPSCMVTYQGLEYPLNRHTLYSQDPLGVSNRITEPVAEIILHAGIALIIVVDEASGDKREAAEPS